SGSIHSILSRPVEQHLEHGLIVLADNSGQQINHLIPAKLREAPDHPKVDQGDAVAREIKHVAWVRIRVKEAVDQDHLEHGIATTGRQHLAVEIRGGNGREVIAADTGHILLHIHYAAGIIPVHFRYENMGVIRKVASEAIDMAGLDGWGELLPQRTSEFGNDPHLRLPAAPAPS